MVLDADGVASNVDHDQNAPDLGLHCMSEYLGSLWYGICVCDKWLVKAKLLLLFLVPINFCIIILFSIDLISVVHTFCFMLYYVQAEQGVNVQYNKINITFLRGQ